MIGKNVRSASLATRPWPLATPLYHAPVISPKRILIVRTSALGDVARTVPALVELRRTYPDATIDWLVKDSFVDVVRAHPALNQPVEFPRDHRKKLPQCVRDLRGAHYDLAVDLEGQFRSAWITGKSRAARRVGYANAREVKMITWWFYNQRAHVPEDMHTVDRMLALLHRTNVTQSDGDPDMRLYVPDEGNQWHQQHVVPNGPYVTLAPTANHDCKCWPIESFIEIAKRLRAAGRRVVVLARPDERDKVQPLTDAVDVDMPTTTVAQLMAVIAGTDLIVCNDSAALHIAVGLDRPAVALFGPTDPALVGPYRRDADVITPQGIEPHQQQSYRREKDNRLIARIAVETVWDRIRSHLDLT